MQLPVNKTILFFSPHGDDEVISAGALLATLAKNNQVIVYYMTNSPRVISTAVSEKEKIKIRQNEAKNACKILGCTAKFLNLDRSLKSPDWLEENVPLVKKIIVITHPSVVLTLHENETHPTHKKIYKIIQRALMRTNIPLWLGEAWTAMAEPNDAFFFHDDPMNLKCRALSSYHSQMVRTDWVTAVKNLNSYRAITLTEIFDGFRSSLTQKDKYAEVFKIS